MDFSDTPSEAAFRAEIRQWLSGAAGEYRDAADEPHDDATLVRLGLEWQAKKAAAGYGAIGLPAEVGGRGGAMEAVIFAEEEGPYRVPTGPFVGIGLSMAMPTLRAHGTAEQIERFVGPTLNGKLAWCQLFSEPSAGSDLAGIRTRAVRDGEDWVVDGQKVWTSWAHHADWALLLARTAPSMPKHKGLTFFVLDMKTPGVDVRPIRQMSGRAEFNEVFLTGVRVPDAMRVGAEGEGWKVTMTTLMNERLASSGDSGWGEVNSETLVALAREAQLAAGQDVGLGSAATREKIARTHALELGLKYFRFRNLTAISRGDTPGPRLALGKLLLGQALDEAATLAMDLQGYSGAIVSSSERVRQRRITEAMYWAAAIRIAAGVDEVILNQIGERVLGLPGDVRVDKSVAFDQLPAMSR